MDSEVMCVITRFEVRSITALVRLYRSFRRIKAHSKNIEGLIATRFLIEGPRTCITLSLWKNGGAILQFNTRVVAHVQAANACFRDLDRGNGRAHLWSAQFKLFAVSPHNLNWDGVEVTSPQPTLAPEHPHL
ncbi:hypothetical protein GCM10011487_70270 [Steroidobacter agaridevorans]|uniref:DUF3291 domain-containing protein n=2 Tax=Steroidobacter agaridevorans TaxID=2695856 RepID=A0A829YNV3_9GAMM|nr:hypothetical protein GCM10011487_70270 [Steroidobacter agaridevorans]GFE86893.1 hypothetical protein GCM10011488_18470 [Steroidobacter agaridevorans]